MAKLTQKHALFELIQAHLPEARDLDSPARELIQGHKLKAIYEEVALGISDGSIPAKKLNGQHPEHQSVQRHARRIVNNALNKDRRLNGNKSYKPSLSRSLGIRKRSYVNKNGELVFVSLDSTVITHAVRRNYQKSIDNDEQLRHLNLLMEEIGKLSFENKAFVQGAITQRKFEILLKILGINSGSIPSEIFADILNMDFWQKRAG